MSSMESSLPNNAIRRISIDMGDGLLWGKVDILSLIRILRIHQTEIMSLAFRHEIWIRGISYILRPRRRRSYQRLVEARVSGLVLSVPTAEDQDFPVITSISNLNRSEYTILMDVPFTTLTSVYMSCTSFTINRFAKWLVNLADLRIKCLFIDDGSW